MNMLLKTIENMTDQEVLTLGTASFDRLYERVSDFFQTPKEVNRSVVYAMSLLRQRDLSCLQLIDLDLSNLNLQYMDFAGATIKGCDFTGSDLSSATFEFAKVEDCMFHNALIIDTFLYSGKFNNNDFYGTDFLYGRKVPELFTENNRNINLGLPNTALAINIDNTRDKALLTFCIIKLLTTKKSFRSETKNRKSAFFTVYPYLKGKVNDQVSGSDFEAFFDQVYFMWGKFNYLPMDLNAIEAALFSVFSHNK